MDALLESLLERFSTLFQDFKKAIAGLPQEALDWVPGEEMNSLCVLVVHTTGATRYWVGDVAFEEPSGRDRNAEFAAKGYTETELITMIDACEAYIRAGLPKLTADDMGKMIVEPGRTREFGVGWSLVHALEHVGLHLGHAQITRQLWDQRQG